MTAINYLAKEIDDILGQIFTDTQNLLIVDAINKAKQIEKEQIMNAYNVGNPYKTAEQYYNETYGSKGSDEFEKTNSQRFDEFMQLVTSSQIEISDEKIENVAWEKYIGDSARLGFIEGAKWYREKLKQL